MEGGVAECKKIFVIFLSGSTVVFSVKRVQLK